MRRLRALLVPITLLSTAALASPVPFEDVTASSGLVFQHSNGIFGARLLPEIMGSGVGLIDFDDDGDLDVYLVNGRGFGERGPTPTDRLFRNDGGQPLRFTDVTEDVGLIWSDYGLGVAVGDFDGDGLDDLYLTNLGPNRLLRNVDGRRFEDVTEAWGAVDDRLSVPATFFDMDADGDLDLYVGNYAAWSEATAKQCRSTTGARDYCSPKVYPWEPDRLLRNDGDRFTNITVSSGLSTSFGAALGIVAADFDGDGSIDLYVANDGGANQLWMNRGGGRFANEAILAGVALNMDGIAEASMGVDAGDVDDDGDLDLFMTHLATETNTLYLNEGDGWFEDRSVTHGLGAPSLMMTGFGTALLDSDNDGDLDVLAVNGAVTLIAEQQRAGVALALEMPNQLYLNQGDGRYTVLPSEPGSALAAMAVSRGLAVGDLDDDGDLDAIVTNNGGPAQLLSGNAVPGARWIGADLREPSGAASTGAMVRFDCAGLPPRWRRARRDGSYASSSDPRVHLGLGRADPPSCDATVIWSDGSTSRHPDLAPGRYHRIRRPEAG
jgi:enediyne biosynthesis protein E4